jgi:ELWxxDGT repeat protein
MNEWKLIECVQQVVLPSLPKNLISTFDRKEKGPSMKLHRWAGVLLALVIGLTGILVLPSPTAAQVSLYQVAPLTGICTPEQGCYIDRFIPAGERVFFVVEDEAGQPSTLWVSDGTPAGTHAVKEFEVAGLRMLAVGDHLFFHATELDGTEGIWVSDGSSAGTARLAVLDDINQLLTKIFLYQDEVYFAVSRAEEAGYQTELWTSDGTPGGTSLVKSVAGWIRFVAGGPDGIYLLVQQAGSPPDLYRSDGTSDGTVLAMGNAALLGYGQYADLQLVNGKLLFLGDYQYLVTTDGTPGGTAVLKEFPIDSYPWLASANGLAYFDAPNEVDGQTKWVLWQTDGTAVGTLPVTDTLVGNDPRFPVEYDQQLYFIGGNDPAAKLYRTGGRATGLSEVTNAYGNNNFGQFVPLQALGGRLYVAQCCQTSVPLSIEWAYLDGDTPMELGPAQATYFSPGPLAELDGALFFAAADAQGDEELWTASYGVTRRFADLHSSGSSAPRSLTPAGNHLFFTTYTNGYDGWDPSPHLSVWVITATELTQRVYLPALSR